jgi:dolichol-phosphate mannosyltransferase
VAGGSVVNWPKSRQFLSRAGNAYARVMLRLPVADATAGFRLYSAAALRAIDLDGVASKGYCFQVDLTLRIIDAGGKIVEIPIEFRERERGESKMSRTIVAEAMVNVTLWGIERAFRRLTHRGDGASSSANDSANRGADRSVSSAETTAAESPVTAVRPPSTPSNR